MDSGDDEYHEDGLPDLVLCTAAEDDFLASLAAGRDLADDEEEAASTSSAAMSLSVMSDIDDVDLEAEYFSGGGDQVTADCGGRKVSYVDHTKAYVARVPNDDAYRWDGLKGGGADREGEERKRESLWRESRVRHSGGESNR